MGTSLRNIRGGGIGHRSFRRGVTLPAAVLGAFALALVASGAAGSAVDAGKAPSYSMRLAGPGTTNELIVRIAEKQGFFRQEGINLQRIELAGGTAILAALTGGSIDVALLGTSNIPIANHNGGKLRGIGVLTTGMDLTLAMSASAAADARVTQRSTPQAKIRALRGKSVGLPTPGSISTVLAEVVMKQQGLDPQKDVKEVFLGSSAGIAAGYAAGRVDAVIHLLPTPLLGLAERPGITLDFGDLPGLARTNWASFVMLQPSMAAKPGMVVAFMRAIVRAREFILNNRQRASQIGRTLFAPVPTAVWNAAYTQTVAGYARGILFTPRGWQNAVGIASSTVGRAMDMTLAEGATNLYLEKAARQLKVDLRKRRT
jgi:ABC-type nitrate/sulfonate/bicarbonate transport system substrate-binding protein